MIVLDESKQKLLSLKAELEDIADAIHLPTLKSELEDLKAKAQDENFWNDLENSKVVLKRTSEIEEKIGEYHRLESQYREIYDLCLLCIEENDESFVEDITGGIEDITAKIEKIRLKTLLSGEYDKNNAILTFHAGAGGTEAQDWAQMLYRMYTRYAERQGFKYKLLDWLDGEEAGIKSATILIEGENAYGYLKNEAGVHRLVRISPFDAGGRRHTSFASLEVMPEIDDSVEIDIRDEDLKVDTYRSGGAGGQHVNKTESAIRITHVPTGVICACQNERSQHQNREVAMKMLRSKLIEIKEREHLERIEDIKGVQKEIAWGSQIRSYVFMPYTLVKDHRTGFESGNIGAVMDGEIEGFINECLKANSGK